MRLLLRVLFKINGLVLLLLLVGCQATAPTAKADIEVKLNSFFHNDVFPGYKTVWIENEQHVFSIDEDVKAFVDARLGKVKDPAKRIKALIGGIFDHADLNLLYENDANTVANATFANRAANCLSLTIMTYAMADYADLHVRFQQVTIPEFWVTRDGYSLLNGHINLRMYTRDKNAVVYSRDRSFQLDFDRRSLPKRLPTQIIDKERVMAMFYNNKGVDALLDNDYDKAYAYFRSALETDDQFSEAWANLGLIYRWAGKLDYAETTYLQAIAVNNDDLTTWDNLSYLYSLTGRQEKADEITARIERKRIGNPNYHFMLGETAASNKDYKEAIKHYRHAIKLDDADHQFYFSMALAYYQLGETGYSEKFMRLAKRHAGEDRLEERYQRKLKLLAKR